MSVSIKDFQPINNWKPEFDGEKWPGTNIPLRLIDETTKRTYLNESRGTVGFKCFLLSLGTPFFHPIASGLNVGYRILKLVSLSHFWIPKKGKYNLKGRVAAAGQDLLRIVATPLVLVGLELAAVYGWFRSYDGRKVYASLERATYGNFIMAPCFQPEPKLHAFGGDINQRNAY